MFASLGLSVILAACNFSKVSRVEHETAAHEIGRPLAKADPTLATVRSTNLNSVYQKTVAIKTETDALNVIQEIETNVLVDKVIDNPGLNMEPTITTALTYYNAAMVQLLTLAPESEKASAQAEKYLAFVSLGCGPQLENCTRLKWVKRDPRTHTVLTHIAKLQDKKIAAKCDSAECEKNVENLFRTISLSFATNHQLKDIELYQLFAKRIHLYASQLEKKKDTEALKQQGVVFDAILANLSATEDEQIILPVVKAQPPWGYSRKKSMSFNFGSEKIFLVASKHLLYENNSLNSQLKQLILDEQKKPTADTTSVFKMAQDLSADPSTRLIFKNLKFDPSIFLNDSFYDEYFFMIDRLKQSHLNYDEVEAIWKGSKKNVDVLSKKVRDIARLELVNLVVKTNRYFSALLQTKNLPSNRLFVKSVDESRPLTDTWDQYFSQLSRLSNLLGQISTNSQLPEKEQQMIESSKNFIMSAKRNATFLSVYPNMLNLGYFMIKIDAKFTMKTWWGAEISIDPKTIVNFLLDGGFETPWYIFSGDMTPLNKSEILLAFDYALRLGSFEIFGQAKDEFGASKIDRFQFFHALKSTMDENIKSLTDTIEKMQKIETDSEGDQLLKMCSRKDFQGTQINIKLEEFEQYALLGDVSKGPISTAIRFYEASSNYYNVPASTGSEKSLSLRTALNNRFLQLRAMSLPLIENIKSLEIPEAEKKQLLAKVNEEIKSVQKKLGQYYTLALSNHHLIKNCTRRLLTAERERQFYFLKSEINYLSDVHDQMSLIFAEKDAAKKADLAKAAAEKLGFTSPEILMGTSFWFTKYALFKRLEHYSKNPSLRIRLEAIEPDDSTKNTLDAEKRTIPFIDPQSETPIDKDRFVRTGLSNFNSGGTNTVQWFRTSANMRLSMKKIESMIAIYRLGFDLGLQSTPVKYKERKLDPVTASEIASEGIDLARSLNITESEEKIMRLMSQSELVSMSDLQGYLFDASETEFNGILDNFFLMASRTQEDFDEAVRYYKERINTKRADSMIFPMDANIETGIHKIYHRLIKKDEALITDFIKAVRQAQPEVEKNPIRIVYRLLDGETGNKVYTPDLIAGGKSLLVDERKINALLDGIHDFHNRLTFRVYQSELPQTAPNTEGGEQ